MAEDAPQLYLVTPPDIDLGAFPDRLAALLDAHAVACVRLALATRDEDALMRAADTVRAVTEQRDVALVIADHLSIATRAGLDGVHLSDGSRGVRAARKALGGDAIVGAHCGASRHDGMNAGEADADYVAFGPLGGTLGDGTVAEPELFTWWSEMIEVPVVAEGNLDEDRLAIIRTATDFVAFGEEIWAANDPLARLSELVWRLQG